MSAPCAAAFGALVGARHRLARHRARVGGARADGPEFDGAAVHAAADAVLSARVRQRDRSVQTRPVRVQWSVNVPENAPLYRPDQIPASEVCLGLGWGFEEFTAALAMLAVVAMRSSALAAAIWILGLRWIMGDLL